MTVSEGMGDVKETLVNSIMFHVAPMYYTCYDGQFSLGQERERQTPSHFRNYGGPGMPTDKETCMPGRVSWFRDC